MSEEKNPKHTDVNQLGEFGLIKHLTKTFKINQESTKLSIGDDAAVISNGDLLTVISTDMMVEKIHFDLIYHPLKHLGYKAIITNLSDICAMNATPKQVTVSIAISNRFSVEALEELYTGIDTACRLYNVDLVGGDTTSIPKGMVISVTAIGQAHKGKVVKRSGAKPGDILCVSGDLGGAYLGLQMLEREKQLYLSDPALKPDLENEKYSIGRQLKPEARLDLVEYFENADLLPTSMIDISDGLASDLFHICAESGVGAFVEENKVPIKDNVQMLALKFNLDPITAALNGGEDYELLFTINPDDLEKIQFMPDVSIIGEIAHAKDGVKLHTTGGNIHPLKAQGWNHFNPNADGGKALTK